MSPTVMTKKQKELLFKTQEKIVHEKASNFN